MRIRFSRNQLCPGHFKPSARHALQEVGGSRSWVRILTSDIGFVWDLSFHHQFLYSMAILGGIPHVQTYP